MDSLLMEARLQRDQMLEYITSNKVNGRMLGMKSYRLMHAFVETLERLHAGDQGAHESMKKWETLAHQMLDTQLFEEPYTCAISMSNPGVVANGADGCTVTLSDMIKHQRALLMEWFGTQ